MQNKTFEGIKENKLFTWIDPDYLKTFKFDQKRFFFYKEGCVIYRINDESGLLYLVVEGKVKLKEYSYRREAVSEVLKIKNDFFGEKELIFRSPRTSAASAGSDCLLYGLNITDLPKYLIRKLYYSNNAILPEQQYAPEEKFFVPSRESENPNARFMRIKAPGKMNFYRELETVPDIDSIFKEKHFSVVNKIPGVHEEIFINESLPRHQSLNDITSLPSDKPIIKQGLDLNKINIFKFDAASEEFKDLFKRLSESVNALYTSGNKPEALLRESARLIDCEKCFLFKIDTGSNELIRSDGFKFKTGLGITGTAAEKKDTIFSNNVKCDPRFVPEYEAVPGIIINSLLCLPLRNQENNAFAVLQFVNKKEEFTDKDKFFLEAASVFLHPFLENEMPCEKENIIFFNKYTENFSSRLDANIGAMRNLSETLCKFKLGTEARKTAGAIYKQTELTELFSVILKEAAGEDVPCKFEIKDFNPLMEDLLQTLADFGDSKSIVLLKKNKAEGHIFLDKQKFTLACFNLISLWCCSLQEGGKIYINTENAGNMIRIEFKTSGNMVSNVVQVDYGLEGLINGISLTEKIIRKFGGSVEISSFSGEQQAVFNLPLSKDLYFNQQ